MKVIEAIPKIFSIIQVIGFSIRDFTASKFVRKKDFIIIKKNQTCIINSFLKNKGSLANFNKMFEQCFIILFEFKDMEK